MRKNISSLLSSYGSLVCMGIYMIVYLYAFRELEMRQTSYHIINFGVDKYIPFCEFFIIPYLLWFAYVAVGVIVLGIKDKEESKRLVAFLIIGMTLFLIISAVFPNGHRLRPKMFARDNMFVYMVKKLYMIDTPTNIVPSIHVYNSIGMMIAFWRTKVLRKKPVLKVLLELVGVSIILSTVFIKQHSMLDCLSACILAAVAYSVCYRSVMDSQSVTVHAKL